MGHRWNGRGANRGALSRMSLALCFAAAILISDASALGINFAEDANDLPPPEVMLKLTQTTILKRVKLFDANPAVLTAFAGTEIEVVIGAGNDQIQPMSASPSYAAEWVQTNIAAYPKTSIVMVALGNEVLSYSKELMPLLLPAFQNLHAALVSAGYGERVKLSTPTSIDIVARFFPPSNCEFHDVHVQVLGPLLDFFAQTDSPFMVNIYPYVAYVTSPDTIPLDYVLFSPSAAAVYDEGSGLYYHNMFDTQVDAIYAALSKLGHDNINVVVSKAGWPSAGKADDVAATVESSQTYTENLIKHLASGVGTPAKPSVTVETFISDFHNKSLKLKQVSTERNFGLYNRRFLTGLWYSPPPPVTGSYPPPPVTGTYPPPVTVYYPPPITVYNPPPPAAGAQPPPLNPYYPPNAPPVTEPPMASYPPPPAPTIYDYPPPIVTTPPPVVYTPPPVIVQIPPPPPPTAINPSPPPVVFPPPIGVGSPPPPSTIFSPPPAPPPPATPVIPPTGSYSPPPPATVYSPPPPAPIIVFSPPPPSTPVNSPPPPLVPWPPPPAPVVISPPPPPTPALPPISTPPPVGGWPPPPAGGWPPPPALGPIAPPIAPWPPGPPTPPVPPGMSSWCVANASADPNKLQVALDWACSAGGADCTAIQPGASCYEPNNLVAHASYAFNSYYTHNNRSSWDCFFSATANLTMVDPSYTNCTYP